MRLSVTLKKAGLLAACLAAVFLISCSRSDGGVGKDSSNPRQGARPGLPMLLELGSVTCIPCQQMVPVLDRLEQEYGNRLQIEFHDVRKSPEVGRAWGVMTIPTQIFLDKDGREVFRHIGYFPYEEIVKILEEMSI